KSGEFSPAIMKKFKIPTTVVVKSRRKAWWSAPIDMDWIGETFPVAGAPKVLIRDLATQHKALCSDLPLSNRNIRQIFIPAGKTNLWQALDVGLNKPVKEYYKAEYHAWRRVNRKLTKSGYLQ